MGASGRSADYVILVAGSVLGGGSLLVFCAFLWLGSWQLLDLGLGAWASLVWDAGLSVLFFAQHSGMARAAFRDWAGGSLGVPERWQAALYSAASGLVLLLLVALWQRSGEPLFGIQGVGRIAARVVFLASLLVFAWGTWSLGSFDAFGSGPIRRHLRGAETRPGRMKIRGAYRWVRHPLYTGTLGLIWSCPDPGLDRLLFDALWTVWIVVGARLEERDLVSELGPGYVVYRRQVPMLIPWRGPCEPGKD